MEPDRTATVRLKKADETQYLTSDGHQSLTVSDVDTLPSGDTVMISGDTAISRPQPVLGAKRTVELLAEIGWAPPERSPAQRVIKRAIDVVLSLMVLVILAPVFALIAIVIKLSDFGPVLYAQTRVGEGGRHFRFFKFRTMVRNADDLKESLIDRNHFQGDITFKLTHDPRVTRVGRFLRRTSLDELPQLWHVLTGEMTLVGPRPAVPSEVAEYNPYELRRVTVRPGLTCYWQVSGRSDLPFERQVELDLQYIENQSLWLDLLLLVRTIPALVLMRGAY